MFYKYTHIRAIRRKLASSSIAAHDYVKTEVTYMCAFKCEVDSYPQVIRVQLIGFKNCIYPIYY